MKKKRNYLKIIVFVVAIMLLFKTSSAYAKEITVTFDTDGGSAVDPVVLDDESLAGANKIPEDPTKNGYTFIGWYPNKSYESYQRYQEYNFHEIYDEDITLYARFIKNENIINEVNVNVEAPLAGTEVAVSTDTSQGALLINQSNRPVATVVGDAVGYEVSYASWVQDKGSYEEEFEGTIVEGNDYFARISIEVKDGYALSPHLNVTVNGEKAVYVYEYYYVDYTMFAGKVKAVKGINVSSDNNDEDKDAKAKVLELINDVIDNKDVEGIDDELAQQIIDAVNNNKTIVVDVESAVVEKDTVADDAKKIEKKLESKQKVGAYFNIGVVLKVDNDAIGNVKKLKDTITISVDIPKDLPKVPEGFTRIFKIFRVHEGGDAEELLANVNGDKVSFDSDSFSTYALVYEDVLNSSNPDTSDSIILYILIFGLSIGAFVLGKQFKKVK